MEIFSTSGNPGAGPGPDISVDCAVVHSGFMRYFARNLPQVVWVPVQNLQDLNCDALVVHSELPHPTDQLDAIEGRLVVVHSLEEVRDVIND